MYRTSKEVIADRLSLLVMGQYGTSILPLRGAPALERSENSSQEKKTGGG
jgi:hypothetical protein